MLVVRADAVGADDGPVLELGRRADLVPNRLEHGRVTGKRCRQQADADRLTRLLVAREEELAEGVRAPM